MVSGGLRRYYAGVGARRTDVLAQLAILDQYHKGQDLRTFVFAEGIEGVGSGLAGNVFASGKENGMEAIVFD